METKEFLNQYKQKITDIKASLDKEGRTKEIFPLITTFRQETETFLESCKDEMLYAIVYNSLATIMSAPEGCSYFQLNDAISDAMAEIEIMEEYI